MTSFFTPRLLLFLVAPVLARLLLLQLCHPQQNTYTTYVLSFWMINDDEYEYEINQDSNQQQDGTLLPGGIIGSGNRADIGSIA